MITPIKLPKLGETMEEGKIVAWKKKPGDKVVKKEILLEVSTDKANFEVESMWEGYLLKIVSPVSDDNIPVLSVIAYIGDSMDEKVPDIVEAKPTAQASTVPAVQDIIRRDSAPAASSVPAGEVRISPLAKKLAVEKGVDITKVKGTGPGGRIVEKDITDYAEKNPAGKPGGSAVAGTPLSGMRKIIADRLSQSKREIPHFYLETEVDMDNCVVLKDKLAKKFPDTKITYNDMIIQAVALALKESPVINANFIDNKIVKIQTVNIGVAVALDDGLVVPVLKSADTKTIDAIAKERAVLVGKARDKKLAINDMSDGSLTLTNLGMFDVDSFTAIINPPQVVIVAVGKIKKAAVVKNDKIVAGSVMKVVLSGDHRVVDGAEGAKFLGRIKQILETVS